MKILLFDINDELIKEAKRLEKYDITSIKIDVNNLVKDKKLDFIVSPANSFGYLDGGIDSLYMKLFPGIQSTVQNTIKNIGLETKSKKYYLPVGSAITVPTCHKNCPNLISSPTMFMPEDINGTRNVTYSFLSILYIAKKNPDKVIACPGLGTGVGHINPKECIDSMEYALENYNKLMRKHKNKLRYYDDTNLIYNKILCKQPNTWTSNDIP